MIDKIVTMLLLLTLASYRATEFYHWAWALVIWNGVAAFTFWLIGKTYG